MEDKGVPAAIVCTDVFSTTAYTVAAGHGVPWYPYSIVPHPIAVLTLHEVQAVAVRVSKHVLQLLTTNVEGTANR